MKAEKRTGSIRLRRALQGKILKARVLQVWTPLKGAVQPYAMLCRADGLKLYDDNGMP